MAKQSAPWMKFYPQDWRADEQLRLCSLAARGLWIEMLAIMHRSERYGQLLISGRVPTDAQLAVQVGAPTEQIVELIGELATAGVFSRAASGAIYSRRMTRDHRKAEIARKNGKTGGNPSLLKTKENPASDNPLDKGGLKPQKPEARETIPNGMGVPPDTVKAIFDLGVSLLEGSGQSARDARSIVGRWRKDHGDGVVIEALVDCQARRISNPVEWMPRRMAAASQSPLANANALLDQAQSYKNRNKISEIAA